VREEAVLLGKSGSLVGVITVPPAHAREASRPAVILLNAGLVHRVGPGRLYVRLARRLAARGFVVVRFDWSGIGDSPFSTEKGTRESLHIGETREAMDLIARSRGVDGFCVMGLCSGAVGALKTILKDSRAVGAVLINPGGFNPSAEWNRYVRNRSWMRIYAGNLLRPSSWWIAISGKTEYGRLADVLSQRLRNLLRRPESVPDVTSSVASEMKAAIQSEARILLVLSQTDYSIDYFREILGRRWEQVFSSRLTRRMIRGADHTLNDPAHQEEAIEAIENWATLCWPDPAVPSELGAGFESKHSS